MNVKFKCLNCQAKFFAEYYFRKGTRAEVGDLVSDVECPKCGKSGAEVFQI